MKKSNPLGLIIIVLLLISNTSFAQLDMESIAKSRPTNSFIATLFDGASIASANYEKLFAMRTTRFLAFGFGVGVAGDINEFMDKNKFITIPHHFTFNTGKKSHFLEFGITASFIPGNEEKNYQLGPLFGYRFQPLKANKLNARVFASVPFIKTDPDMFYSPLGLSFGYCF